MTTVPAGGRLHASAALALRRFLRRGLGATAKRHRTYAWECQPAAGFAGGIEQLLRLHFGPGSGDEMQFAIAHFRSTFDAIFKEAAQSRARIHADLTFLGVGLVGLYLTLEALGVPLQPRVACAGAT